MTTPYRTPGVYISDGAPPDPVALAAMNRVLDATEQAIAASAPTPVVIRLAPGAKAPAGADIVEVTPLPAGGYRYSFVVAIPVLSDGGTRPYTSSGAVDVDGRPLTAAVAEAAGIAAALGSGAMTLYVSVADGSA